MAPEQPVAWCKDIMSFPEERPKAGARGAWVEDVWKTGWDEVGYELKDPGEILKRIDETIKHTEQRVFKTLILHSQLQRIIPVV